MFPRPIHLPRPEWRPLRVAGPSRWNVGHLS